MSSLTLDANIIIKWIFPEISEDHIPQALSILKGIKAGQINVIQPPQWLAEVAAVIARIQPKIMDESISLLDAMELPIVAVPEVYHLAGKLSQEFNHHLFDTLYHAVALYQGNTQFVTADEKYYKKAFKKGGMVRLGDFSIYDDI